MPDFIIYIMSMSALHILECRAGTMSCISYIKYFVSILQSPAQPRAYGLVHIGDPYKKAIFDITKTATPF